MRASVNLPDCIKFLKFFAHSSEISVKFTMKFRDRALWQDWNWFKMARSAMKFKIVLRDLRLNLKRRDACTYALSNATPTLCCVKKRAEILSVNFKLKYESCVFFIAYRAYLFHWTRRTRACFKILCKLCGLSVDFKFLNLGFKFKLKIPAGLN